ncbi:MAG TPA: AMP-binding protein, partial [Burkholderiales bacterium]|nr:AMP-binding protein [Burkholderiales bacterium]
MREPGVQVEQRLIEVIGAMLAELRGGPPPPAALGDKLERDLGIDSLARVELTLRIERAFGVQLPEERASEAETVRDLRDAVAIAAPRRAPQAAVETRAAPPAPPVGEPRDARTLRAALEWHTTRHAERVHITLQEDGEQAETLTYGALAAQARATARGFQARGLEPGQAVAIMLPSSLAFFRAFAGVLLAGGVPVPIYPPFRWSQIEDHLRRQARILENCRAPLLVTVEQARPVARLLSAEVATLRHVVTADELAAAGQAAVSVERRPQDVALIQYTSGSTGQPKGVVLTHANLLANIRAMGEAVEASSRDVFVSWLPLYHDMGLIGAWLGSLYYGVPLVLMPPQKFLARPSRWLRAIQRHRGTLSAGPNFAYEIAAAKIPDDELQGLDLSSWRVAFNGAEPVRAATLERFTQRFARYGFDARALMPVYGLAESAVGLTFPPLGRGPLVERIDRQALAREGRARPVKAEPPAMSTVSCGRPLRGHEVRVLDARGGEAPERVEGRIEFRGASATSGYFENAGQTAKLLREGWLDTGDVGYIAGGELYLTSRVKDLIVRGGHNIHPYDLEEAVGVLPGIRKGCVAVFGATDRATGTERIVVVAETREKDLSVHEALKDKINELAIAYLGVPADDIVLAGLRRVLKTSSGKIRRAAMRELYERGALGAAQRPVTLQLARLAVGAALAWIRGLARRLAGWLFVAYAWSLFAVLSLFGGALLLLLPRSLGPRWARTMARAMVALSGVPLRVEGKERVAGALPAVVVANHASYADAILLAALLPPDIKFVAKRELAAYPAGPFLRRIGVRFVERFRTQRAIEDARELADGVRGGESQLLFPEGRFWRAPGLRQFHMGAFAAAAQSGRPVLPVALRGT